MVIEDDILEMHGDNVNTAGSGYISRYPETNGHGDCPTSPYEYSYSHQKLLVKKNCTL